MEVERRCVCGHGEFDHVDDNENGRIGCQMDVMTPDGPFLCDCVEFKPWND